MADTRTHLKDTEDVVAWIAATVSRTIANAGHPGHDITTVMHRMTTDKTSDTIRAAYVHWCQHHTDRTDGIRRIGVRLIEEYRRTYDI